MNQTWKLGLPLLVMLVGCAAPHREVRACGQGQQCVEVVDPVADTADSAVTLFASMTDLAVKAVPRVEVVDADEVEEECCSCDDVAQ